METLRNIITNLVLLFGLVFMVNLSTTKLEQNKFLGKISVGFIIGIITVITMMNAWEMSSGAIFDTRSVMISVSALFFPTLTSFIATVIAILYRIYVGGDGIYAGILTLLFAFSFGVFWKNVLFKKLKINKYKYLSLYIYGLIVHIVMILFQMTFPYPKNIEIIKTLGPIIITVFPVAVLVLSIAILNHDKFIESQDLIRKSEEKYRTLVNQSKLGIIQYNLEGTVELANQAYADILNVEIEKLVGLNLKSLPNKAIVNALDISLNGDISIFEDYYTTYISNRRFPARMQFSPIYDNDIIIGGLATIEDLTHQKELQENIEVLKNKDLLTNLYNRATFDEFIFTKVSEIYYPISIATFDINTFQVINTSFGYDVGNQVLITIADVFNNYSKQYENIRAYRIGGDEFAIIMLNTPYNYANEIVTKIQNSIFGIDIFDFEINISCGINTSYSRYSSITDTFNSSLANMMSNKIYDGSSISIKTIDLIMNTLFEKSKRERMHSERVSQISRKIAEKLNLGTAFCNRVELAGRLHDIGKITISEEILDKPSKLSKSEWLRIKKHPETGFKILSSVSEYLDIANVVFAHHEKYDGSGYPKGLKGSQIPLEARIIGVADAFDAMTVTRPYRQGMTIEEAIQEIEENANTQFDADIARIMIELLNNKEL